MRPSLFLGCTLLLSLSCGCKRQPTLIDSNESIAFRIVATQNSDGAIVETANTTTGRFVTLDERVVAEWAAIRNFTSSDANNVTNAVTRRTQSHVEVLVLHTANDISEAEIASVKGFTDRDSRNLTLVTLTDAGSRMLFPLTVENVDRFVAVIANGEVRAIPRIASPVRKEMVLSREHIDKVRVVPSPVN